MKKFTVIIIDSDADGKMHDFTNFKEKSLKRVFDVISTQLGMPYEDMEEDYKENKKFGVWQFFARFIGGKTRIFIIVDP